MNRFSAARPVALVAALAAVLFCCGWAALEIPKTQTEVATTLETQTAAVQTTAERTQRLESQLAELSAAVADRQERIVELPQDGGQFLVSVLVHKDWRNRPKERALVAYWHTDPRLVSVRVQTKWYVIAEDEDNFKRRFAHVTPVLPSVYVQRADGLVVHKQSGEEICESADAVAGPIVNLFKNRPWLRLPWNRPRPPCPCPDPKPGPNPNPRPGPDVDVVVPIIPDTAGKDAAKNEPAFPWALLVGTVLLAGGIAAAVALHRQVRRAA